MSHEQQPYTGNPHSTGNQLTQDDDAKFFLASIINTLQDSVVTVNLEGVITSWNRSAERLYGYSATEAIGKSLHLVMFPKDFEPLHESIETIRKGHSVPVYQTLRIHKGGHDLFLEITLSPILDAQGTVIGVSTVARNVSELNKTLEALGASESQLRAIIEAAIDFAIIIVDLQGNILDWSSGAQRMFGYSKEEVIGTHTEIIFTPEDRHGGIPMVEIETARSTGKSFDERWHLRKDGSRFFMSGVMTPLHGGPVAGMVKIARNITDRKLAEEALLISEERKSLAVKSAEMGEWEWDINTGSIHFSETARALAGLPAADAEMSPHRVMLLIYPPDQPALLAQLETAMNGLQILQAEYRIVRADNQEIRWVNTYGRVVAQEAGRSSRMIGVVYDITARKVLEKQKDDFISQASHELKTPVSAIKAFSELLEENTGASSGAAFSKSILKKLNGQVDRLIKLIHDLLDASTITEGKMTLHPEPFDINEAIGEQIEPFQRIAGSRRIKWEPAAVSMVHADRDRILQVVTNFVSNAVKYSPKEGEVVISTEDKLDGVIVKVRDAGPGIPQEVQPYLFDRYYRVPNQQLKGFGLGLYISAAIIRQHMGTIGVESVPDKGATFYFTLPYS
jgi:PAS domain S-box-containing protein